MEKALACHNYFKALVSSSSTRQKKCRKIREDYGLKVKEIAQFIGVTVSTVYRWEQKGVPAK
jgi:DNA-binding transcriptional regulator YiaG